MSTVYNLDSVIRKVQDKAEQTADEQLIILDEKSNELLDKVPMVKWGRRLGYYLVSNTNIAKCSGISYQLGNQIIIHISYFVNCPDGNENKIVKNLYKKGLQLEDSLNKRVKSWVTEYVAEHDENSIISDRTNLAKFLVKRCQESIGLRLRPTISFQNEDKLSSFAIKTKSFSVRAKDYNLPLQLFLETELNIIESKKTDAILKSDQLPQLEDKIKASVKNYFRENITLHQFCFSLNRQIQDGLQAELNELVEDEGRSLNFLSLSSPSINNLIREENPLRVEQKVLCDIDSHNEKIVVESVLVLELKNLGVFRNSNIDDLRLWIKEEQVPNLIQDVLWKKTYKDVLLEIDTIRTTIEDTISKKIDSIGYFVKQHTFIPDLQPIKLKNNGFNHEFTASFFTSDSRVPINIKVFLKGFIDDLSALPDRLLDPKIDIIAEVEEEVKGVIQDEIHVTDPETAYRRFNFDEQGKSVKEILEGKIKKLLVEKFKVSAESAKPTVKLAESDITRKVDELIGRTHKFSTSLTSRLGNAYKESINFHIRFDIKGIHANGWAAFQKNSKRSSEEELEEIKEVLQERTKDFLESVSYQELMTGKHSVKEQLKKLLTRQVFATVTNSFGLIFELVTINRDETVSEYERQQTFINKLKFEEQENRVLAEQLIINKRADLQALLSKRTQLIENELYDEAEEINEQIKKLKEELKIGQITQMGEERTQSLLGISEENTSSLSEFSSSQSLLTERSEEQDTNNNNQTTDYEE